MLIAAILPIEGETMKLLEWWATVITIDGFEPEGMERIAAEVDRIVELCDYDSDREPYTVTTGRDSITGTRDELLAFVDDMKATRDNEISCLDMTSAWDRCESAEEIAELESDVRIIWRDAIRNLLDGVSDPLRD
jgi:hypothetical protein